MEIEVGEYIRTNQAIIGKIKRIELDKTDKSLKWYVFDKKRPDMNIIDEIYINKPYIVNHSKQLIDLIEVGDIVNGYRVENVINEGPCPSGKCVDIDSSKDSSECTLWEEDIQTILTKEQMEANCYKVGGEDE